MIVHTRALSLSSVAVQISARSWSWSLIVSRFGVLAAGENSLVDDVTEITLWSRNGPWWRVQSMLMYKDIWRRRRRDVKKKGEGGRKTHETDNPNQTVISIRVTKTRIPCIPLVFKSVWVSVETQTKPPIDPTIPYEGYTQRARYDKLQLENRKSNENLSIVAFNLSPYCTKHWRHLPNTLHDSISVQHVHRFCCLSINQDSDETILAP